MEGAERCYEWAFASTHARHEELQALVGQPSWGTWRLEVSDRVSGNSGVLKEWGVCESLFANAERFFKRNQ